MGRRWAGKTAWESMLEKARSPPATGKSMWKGAEAQRGHSTVAFSENMGCFFTRIWSKEGRAKQGAPPEAVFRVLGSILEKSLQAG